ncbi:hypothetical protein ACFL0Q_01240 [Thermodesulfobacteriota bacterium]
MEQLLLSQYGKDVIVQSQAYENENEIQEIVKKNPALINLSSIFESPILIIGRESMHIDVLGLTVDAVPVVIECKRKENPDMRYLIAQVFEYASKLEQLSYNEFDELVTRCLASDRCQESAYRNLTTKEAFRKFRESNMEEEESEEAFNDEPFVSNVSENLKNGEFYLVIVVDQITDIASRTIDFLNRKLERLRVEVIEIAKFSDQDRKIYVPSHVNKEVTKPKPKPGKTTFEEMIAASGAREAELIRELRTAWKEEADFSISMGSKGFSARYRDIPILYVFPTYMRIAPKVRRKYGDLFRPTIDLLEKHFERDLQVGVSLGSASMTVEKIRAFLHELKELWREKSGAL